MNTHQERSARENDYLLMAVSSRNGNTGKPLTTPLPGHIINISKHGACLFMSKIMDGSFHIFHSTRENDSLFLQLDITVPPEDKHFTLTAIPIWFDLFRNGQRQGFKIGVEFIPPPEKEEMKLLQESIKMQQKERCKQFYEEENLV